MKSAIRHESTVIRMYAPALWGEPGPLNWHLSFRLAGCTDRSIMRNGERCSTSKAMTEEEDAWRMKMRGGRGRGWRGGGGETGGGETSKACWRRCVMREARLAAWCFSTSTSFWFVSMCLWCCFFVCLCQSLLLDPQILLLLFWHCRCSCFTLRHTHSYFGLVHTLTPTWRQNSIYESLMGVKSLLRVLWSVTCLQYQMFCLEVDAGTNGKISSFRATISN